MSSHKCFKFFFLFIHHKINLLIFCWGLFASMFVRDISLLLQCVYLVWVHSSGLDSRLEWRVTWYYLKNNIFFLTLAVKLSHHLTPKHFNPCIIPFLCGLNSNQTKYPPFFIWLSFPHMNTVTYVVSSAWKDLTLSLDIFNLPILQGST